MKVNVTFTVQRDFIADDEISVSERVQNFIEKLESMGCDVGVEHEECLEDTEEWDD